MQNIEQLTLAEMEDFLTGSGQLEYRIASDDAYRLIERVLSGR